MFLESSFNLSDLFSFRLRKDEARLEDDVRSSLEKELEPDLPKPSVVATEKVEGGNKKN